MKPYFQLAESLSNGWRTPGTTGKWDGGIAVGPDGNIKRDTAYPVDSAHPKLLGLASQHQATTYKMLYAAE